MKYLPDEIHRRLLKHLRERVIEGSVDALLIEIMARTGIRIEELANLKREHVCTIDTNIHVNCPAKGGNKRVIPVDEVFADILVKKLDTFALSPTDKIVKILGSTDGAKQESIKRRIYNAFKRIMLKVEFKYARYSPHCLRHTFAIKLYKTTNNVMRVKYALGHKSLSSTGVYIDFVTAQDSAPDILLAVG